MPGDTSAYNPDFAALLINYNTEVEKLMAQLEKKAITVKQWQAGMQGLLAKYGQAARMLGGDLESLSIQDVKSVKVYLKEQFKYLNGFTTVVKSTPDYNPAWLTRAQMYGSSTSTQYWEGKTSGLPLPAQPGQGSQCLGNCRCKWNIEWINKETGDADCYWILGDAKHCQTCEIRARMWSPVRIRNGNLEL